MDNWPNIPLPTACPSGIRDPLLEDEFQSGDDAARPQFAAPRCLPITLSWNWMHKTHLATLRTFQKAHRTDLFLWEDPFTGEQWEARFAGEEPVKWGPIAKLPDYAQVTATIKPVNEVILPAGAPVTKRKPSYILSAEIGLSSEVVQRASEQTYRREDGSLGVMPANTLVPTVKNGRKCFEIYGWRRNLITDPENLQTMNRLQGQYSELVEIGNYFGNGCKAYRLDQGSKEGFIVRLGSIVQEDDAFYTMSFLAHNPTGETKTFSLNNDHNVGQHMLIKAGETKHLSSTYQKTAGGKDFFDIEGSVTGCIISEMQIEKGKVASPYIPPNTNGNVRVATKVTQSAKSWFNANEGTFIVEFIQNKNNLYANYIRLGKWSQEPALILVKTTAGDTVYAHYGAMSDSKTVRSSVKIDNVLARVAISYKYNDFLKMSVNGESPRSTSIVGVTKVPSTKLEYFISGAEGDLIDCIYYPEAVTDEELQAFSEVRHA